MVTEELSQLGNPYEDQHDDETSYYINIFQNVNFNTIKTPLKVINYFPKQKIYSLKFLLLINKIIFI